MSFDEWVTFSQTSDQMPGEGALIWRMLVDWSTERGQQTPRRPYPVSALLASAVVAVVVLAGLVWYVWCRCPP